MRRDDIDRILSTEQEIAPSSGFASSVMAAVQSEAAAPPPIPFPWKRALPGLAAVGIALVSILIVGITSLSTETATQPLPAGLQSTVVLAMEEWKTVGASWIVLALGVSFASVKLSTRFASRKI